MRDLFAPDRELKPLRQHQADAVAMLRQSLVKGFRRPVLQLPTGAGKTRTAAELVNLALEKGNGVAFTVPAISLIDQTVEAFEEQGITRVNVMQGNHPRRDPMAKVHVVSVQTLAKRDRPNVGMVICDEAHMQFKPLRQWMQDEPRKPFIGLSATPWARGMADYWDDLIQPVTMDKLIADGFLSPFRVFAPSHPDLSSVRITKGDFNEREASEAMSDKRIVGDVVSTWKAKARGLPTLVFAVDLAHAETLQRAFASAGIPMGYCNAHTDRIERQVLFDRMKAGELAGICNVGTLTTGVDADIRCVVLARPTRSEMLFTQMIGRALRPAPGKEWAVILDHADNHARHGFVTDIHHDKLLTGQDRQAPTRKEQGEKLPKECGKCGALRSGRECLACGFVASRQSEIEHEAGELVEVKGKKKTYTREEKQAWWSQLMTVAMQRGRSKGWASNTYREKFGVWPVGLDHVHATPSPEVLSYCKSKDIRFAHSRNRRAA